MSFKFSLVPLAATLAVLASPLVASAGTLTSQNTRNPRSTQTDYVIIDERPINQNQTNQNVSQRIVPNYVGIGGSNRGAALDSKIGFTNHISFRPLAIDNLKSDGQEGNFSIPVTYDFQPVIGKLQPYAGAGVGLNTKGDDEVGPMLTAGADYPINKNITANASVNFDAYGSNDVNGIVGIAANIGG